MMVLAVLAVAFALGVDPRRLGILAVALYLPLVFVGLVILLAMGRSRTTDTRPALFCESVADELRSGATLRHAVMVSAAAVEAPEVATSARGGDVNEMALSVAAEFPGVARELEVTMNRVGGSGAMAADLFDEIGALALAQEEIRREVKVAATPARAAVAVFIGLPAIYLFSQWSGGGLADLVATPGQQVMGLVGLGLFLVGLLVAVFLVWRAR